MYGKVTALVQVPNKRLFSRREAATYLGMHVHTLDKLAATGLVAAYQDGGKIKFRLEDLDGYIDSMESYNPKRGEARKEAS